MEETDEMIVMRELIYRQQEAFERAVRHLHVNRLIYRLKTGQDPTIRVVRTWSPSLLSSTSSLHTLEIVLTMILHDLLRLH